MPLQPHLQELRTIVPTSKKGEKEDMKPGILTSVPRETVEQTLLKMSPRKWRTSRWLEKPSGMWQRQILPGKPSFDSMDKGGQARVAELHFSKAVMTVTHNNLHSNSCKAVWVNGLWQNLDHWRDSKLNRTQLWAELWAGNLDWVSPELLSNLIYPFILTLKLWDPNMTLLIFNLWD